MQTDTSYSTKIDMSRIPQHVAIIMDGNGRWAKARGLDRSIGHKYGVETVKKVTESAIRVGVKYLTLYAFSTENWNRPQVELSALMSLILTSIEEELFMKNNVRLLIIGDTGRLPKDVREALMALVERTSGNTGLTEIVALSYSSKWELTEAVRAIAREAVAGTLNPDEITENDITSHLATAGAPDPELLIRTGGEIRLSNYLLWQCAYSELYFCETYWPDFGHEDFCKAIYDYQQRERRFGKTSEQVATDGQTPTP